MRDFTICIVLTFRFRARRRNQSGRRTGRKGRFPRAHHYGGAYLETSGLRDAVRRSLGRAGISYTAVGGVKPNPRLDAGA